MTKKELMIKAHKLTKEIKNEYPEIDYKFQLGLCLSFLVKGEDNMTIEERLNELGCKTWEKKDGEIVKAKRVYINDFGTVAEKLGYEMCNRGLFNKTSIHYDVLTDTFNFSCQNSVKKHVNEVIEILRAAAN